MVLLRERRAVFSIGFILSNRLVYVHALHFLPADADRQLHPAEVFPSQKMNAQM